MTAQHDIRLFLADVDGALVTKDKVLTEAAKAAVRELDLAGIAFAITAEKRRYPMVPIVLQMACSAARPTIRPPDGVAPGLGGSDPLLNARLQQLRFGQGQTRSPPSNGGFDSHGRASKR